MTPKDVLTNPYFCPMPWTGLMYNFDGTVKNCIRSAAPIGNIQQHSIQEILHGKENIQTQNQIIDRQPGKNCHPCYDLERGKNNLDMISDRIFYIRELKHVPLETYQSNNHELHTIDVRWSNLCNFGCVYCGPTFSSRWAQELRTEINEPSEEQKNSFKSYIFDHAATLKHVYLAGGEPLLMKQNLELLDILQKVNPTVSLRVNTNLSKADTAVFDRLCDFPNVHWTVSVESLEEEFEYIRYGGKWKDFCENLGIIKKLPHKITFNMLHFLLNFRSFFDCVAFLQKSGFHNNSFVAGALLNPDYLNIRHLPDFVLESIKKTLENKIDERPGYLLEDSYRNIRSYLDQPMEKNLSRSFDELTEMDRRRNLDSKKTFLELYSLK